MYITVHANAGARREQVIKNSSESLSISVREPARNNAANRRIQTLVADMYNVSVGSVRLVSGHRSPKKVFSVETNE